MIAFTLGEILSSLIYAAIYGAVFSAVYSGIKLLCDTVLSIPGLIGNIFVYESIFHLPNFRKNIVRRKIGSIFTLLLIILFTLGFVLISYLTLDGVIRLYVLFVAFASFYLSNFVFCDILSRVFLWIFDQILKLVCLIVRILIHPFRMLIRKK